MGRWIKWIKNYIISPIIHNILKIYRKNDKAKRLLC